MSEDRSDLIALCGAERLSEGNIVFGDRLHRWLISDRLRGRRRASIHSASTPRRARRRRAG